jgi:hypothetical protein
MNKGIDLKVGLAGKATLLTLVLGGNTEVTEVRRNPALAKGLTSKLTSVKVPKIPLTSVVGGLYIGETTTPLRWVVEQYRICICPKEVPVGGRRVHVRPPTTS